MEPLTYEAVNRNPELIQALIEQARRERAEAMHRLVVEPIKRLFVRHLGQQAGAARKLVFR